MSDYSGRKVRRILILDANIAYEVGQHGVVSMTMESMNGQMALVPWVRMVVDGREQWWNAATLAMVEYESNHEAEP